MEIILKAKINSITEIQGKISVELIFNQGELKTINAIPEAFHLIKQLDSIDDKVFKITVTKELVKLKTKEVNRLTIINIELS